MAIKSKKSLGVIIFIAGWCWWSPSYSTKAASILSYYEIARSLPIATLIWLCSRKVIWHVKTYFFDNSQKLTYRRPGFMERNWKNLLVQVLAVACL